MKGVFSNERPHPFPKGDNIELANLDTTQVKGTQGFTNEDNSILQEEMMVFSFPYQCYDIIRDLCKCVYCFDLFSQVSNKANGLLVYKLY